MDAGPISEDDPNQDALARACAERMWGTDNASRTLGMEIVDISAGRAVLRMKIRRDMTNGQKICHGGYMFLLADSAFAFACNGANQFTVAQHCSIDFLKAVSEGTVLTATAVERQKTGRTGIYDATVCDENNVVVAEFRGLSRTVKGTHLNADELLEINSPNQQDNFN